jgi:hypothetical protein
MTRFYALICGFWFFGVGAQPAPCPISATSNCDGWPYSRIELQNQQSNQQLEFKFDQISSYTAGITYYGSTLMRATVSDTSGSGTCNWKLNMIVTNGGGTTPSSEMETLINYGSGNGAKPPLSLIQVRVSNACGTPINNGVWQTFQPVDGDMLPIIDEPSFNIPAGTCDENVNGAGSYLTNFGEFAFIIDYRIIPLFNYIPGKYQLNIKFCITE